jgi:hypothetical protein
MTTDPVRALVTELRCRRIKDGQRCQYTETMVWNDLQGRRETRPLTKFSRDLFRDVHGLQTNPCAEGQPAIPGIGLGGAEPPAANRGNRNGDALEERMGR